MRSRLARISPAGRSLTAGNGSFERATEAERRARCARPGSFPCSCRWRSASWMSAVTRRSPIRLPSRQKTPWARTLHLPPGGTAELVAGAKAAAQVNVDAKAGPHGGVIQVVGNERFEVVANESTGEARVYLLDPDLKVVAIGDRKITLGVVA